MTSLFIAAQSATRAMKCRDVLKKNGFFANVQKKSRFSQGGCTFGVQVTGNKDKIFKVLLDNDIKDVKIYEL